ncbi:hypothetical protein IID62_11605, partial [candidate division KSB1 bacterium]|nr:hypothetical protein [candidate division KSB1 bacterium]
TVKLIQSKNLDLKRKKLEVDNRYKEIMIKIKEKELSFDQTFDKTPSSQAKIAIKTAVNTESYEPPEEKKLNEIKKQGSVLALRFITGDYTLPLGVWVTRESARKSMQSKPIE